MAEEGPTELEQAFEKLQGLIASSQHQKTLKAIDAILKLSPNDVDAIKCKVVAHLQLGEFEAAAEALAHKKLAGSMAFERAYCQYKLSKFQEALKLLDTVPEGAADAALELRAQLAYRLGDTAGCVDAYAALREQGKAGSLEVQTNILAAYVVAGLAAQLPKLMSSLKLSPKASFEIGFNRACGLISAGDLAGAEAALKAALKQGEEALYEEDLAEEEVADELAPLSVQLAYVQGAQGRHTEALARLDALAGRHLSDPAAGAVAANNHLVEGWAAEGQAPRGLVSRTVRRLDALLDKGAGETLRLAPSLDSRMSTSQKAALHLNRALLALVTGKVDAAAEIASALGRAGGGGGGGEDALLLALLQATLLARGGKASEADSLLASLSAAQPPSSSAAAQDGAADPSLYPSLLRTQLALERGDTAAALQLLGQLASGPLAGAPAVLATRAALLEQSGDSAGAEALLDAQLAELQGLAGGGDASAAQGAAWCLQRAVALKLALGKIGEAAALYRRLASRGLADSAGGAAVLARLARAAAAAGDAAALASLREEVVELGGPAAGAGVDADALERDARAVTSSRRREELARKRDADEDAEGGAAKAKRPRKRKKKPRYPKGYDPALPNGGLPPPDPERWLPKWQRSDFKKKQSARRRRERADQVKGSQGAGKVDEALDRTKGPVEEAKASPSKPALPQRGKKGGRR